MCGKCCQAIVLNVSREEIEQMASVQDYLSGKIDRTDLWNDDPIFIYLNWTPISTEDALRINPHIQTWFDAWEKSGQTRKWHFYKCSKLTEDNKCGVHDERPRVCREFPWYGKQPRISELFYADNCGYKIDIENLPHSDGLPKLVEGVT